MSNPGKTKEKSSLSQEKLADEKSENDSTLLPAELTNESFKSFVKNVIKFRIKLGDEFILKIPETMDNEFMINKVIGFHKDKRPKFTWEFLSLSSYQGMQEIDFTLPSKFLPKSALTISQKAIEEKGKFREIKKLQDQIKNINESISQLQADNLKLKEDLYNLVLTSNQNEKTQFIPIDIYLDTNDPQEIFSVYESVKQFSSSIGFQFSFDFKAVSGSWYKKLVAKSKQLMTDDQVVSRLKEAEYGLEANMILKQQSEIDKNQSEALLNILKSVENIPNAAIRIGSLIVVKITDKSTSDASVQVRSLSILEMHTLNKNPELLQNPKEILYALANEISKGKEISNN